MQNMPGDYYGDEEEVLLTERGLKELLWQEQENNWRDEDE